MGRYPQPIGDKGSLKWIQKLVNDKPDLLNKEVSDTFGLNADDEIEWVSPLAVDDYTEYRDEAFLKRIGVKPEKMALKEFWPRYGPQWDALGRTSEGAVFLVEAKAHIQEIVSPPTGAKGESLQKIRSSLAEVKKYVNATSGADWSSYFYQYTNRIAHLYFLRVLNQIPAYLVFLSFINDNAMGGPSSEAEWNAATTVMKKVLGIGKNKLNKFVGDVFIDVNAVIH